MADLWFSGPGIFIVAHSPYTHTHTILFSLHLGVSIALQRRWPTLLTSLLRLIHLQIELKNGKEIFFNVNNYSIAVIYKPNKFLDAICKGCTQWCFYNVSRYIFSIQLTDLSFHPPPAQCCSRTILLEIFGQKDHMGRLRSIHRMPHASLTYKHPVDAHQ